MTKNEMLRFVKNSFPDLTINDIQVNNRGWDNDILIVNEKIVFRFPKSNNLLSVIVEEGKLLEILRAKEPLLHIPNYGFVYSDNELKGVTYSLIEGKSLNQITIPNLRDNPVNARVIGDFLTKLHSLDVSSREITLKTTHTLSYWEDLYSNVTSALYPFINKQQVYDIDHFFTNFIEVFPRLTFKKSVIHGDLTASNIIYNQEKKGISGIIDFTDAQIGDPAFDFAGLYWDFGPDFTKDVLHWYSGNETSNSLYNRVKAFYGLQPVFHELLYAVKNRQQVNWETALEKFSSLYELTKK
ncbi:aminoglycoside phosphotransferase family protein [Fredinandcohnia humi]